MFPGFAPAHNPMLAAASVAAACSGVLIAWALYVWRPALPDVIAGRLGLLYKLVAKKYYVDEIYGAVLVRPLVDGSRETLWRGVDVDVIDSAVNGVGRRALGVGSLLRLAQSGNIRSYAAWVLLGSVCVLVAVVVMGGWR
jgi:NADH-quinone oxidoreductase subunit L